MDSVPGSADFLGPLLRALAESLDVREIFARISAEARRVVPHEFLMMGIMSPDRQRVRILALSGDPSGSTSRTVVSRACRSSPAE